MGRVCRLTRPMAITHLRLVDAVPEIAGVAVLHDNAQAVLVEERVGVAHDVGVAHPAQELNLVLAGLLLLRWDVLELDHLAKFWRGSTCQSIHVCAYFDAILASCDEVDLNEGVSRVTLGLTAVRFGLLHRLLV